MSSSGWKLYGDPGSGSAAVELALAEAGVDYDLEDISLGDNAQREPAYADVNAHRKLPALLSPEQELLTESAAILIGLAERYPTAKLLPRPADPERGAALRWLLFIATELYPLIEIIDYPERFSPDDATSAHREAARARVREIWKQRWLLFQAQIAGDPWILRGGFSVVDLYAAVVSRWAQVAEWRVARLPAIERIAAGVASRPRCRPVWERHFGTDLQ